MPRKPKAPPTLHQEAPIEAPLVRQAPRTTREAALAMKPTFSLSCFQEAGAGWRLIYTKPAAGGWIVGTVDTLGTHEEKLTYPTQLEANQHFHEVLKQWGQ